MGKHPNFGKPPRALGKISPRTPEAHFCLHHYAGTVSYSVHGWLEKNRDPINTTVAALFKASKTNELVKYLFRDMGNEAEDSKKSIGKAKKGSAMQTISSGHRVLQQSTMLHSTTE